jgi:hypothetical protein
VFERIDIDIEFWVARFQSKEQLSKITAIKRRTCIYQSWCPPTSSVGRRKSIMRLNHTVYCVVSTITSITCSIIIANKPWSWQIYDGPPLRFRDKLAVLMRLCSCRKLRNTLVYLADLSIISSALVMQFPELESRESRRRYVCDRRLGS